MRSSTAMFQTEASAPDGGMAAARQYHSAAAAPHERSPWHSPVPYLFGGLAAMLGLIAFALLLLACSYWKLSGYLDSSGDDGGDPEAKPGSSGACKLPPLPPEQRIMVIMAGDDKPTFLATPVSTHAATSSSSSSGDNASAGAGSGRTIQAAEGEKVADAADPIR